MAAVQNDRFLVDALLRRGVDVDFRVVDRSTSLSGRRRSRDAMALRSTKRW
jgi:hypothetical protein